MAARQCRPAIPGHPLDFSMRLSCKQERRFAPDACLAKIAKVESHAKGACSVLHGRDASCLRRQPKIAKVESHAKGACSVLHGRDASCLRRQPKIAKVESHANFEGGVLKDSESRARRRTGPESLVPARGSPGRVGWRSVEKYEAAWGQRRKARKKVLFLQLPFS